MNRDEILQTLEEIQGHPRFEYLSAWALGFVEDIDQRTRAAGPSFRLTEKQENKLGDIWEEVQTGERPGREPAI